MYVLYVPFGSRRYTTGVNDIVPLSWLILCAVLNPLFSTRFVTFARVFNFYPVIFGLLSHTLAIVALLYPAVPHLHAVPLHCASL